MLLFKISKKEKGTFKYIGLNIEQNGSKICVDQQTYIDVLKEIHIDNTQKKNNWMTNGLKKKRNN